MPTELWFPERGKPTTAGVEICQRCDARSDCLEYALADPELNDHGVFGGLSAAARRELREERRQARADRRRSAA